MTNTTSRYHVQYYPKADGRGLYLYSWDKNKLPAVEKPAQPIAPAQLTPGVLDWHPLLDTYVNTAPGRQNRTFQPTLADCPLCPSPDGKTEIPFTDFDIAIFDNRFPAFVPADQAAPLADSLLHPAHGKCEVVVYTADHHATLGQIDQAHRELLIEAWVHRYDTLLGLPGIQFVLPFENRGIEIGTTLDHPHGQIYALPFLPPIQQRMAQSFAKDPATIAKTLDKHDDLILAEQDGIVAFIPRFGYYSYEIWLAPRVQKPGLWALDRAERQAVATLMGKVSRVYDQLFNRKMPSIMAVQSAPLGHEKNWHMHITFQPFLRTAEKLKYVAGVELTSGHFLKDVSAIDAYNTLKPLFDGDQP